jgi:23S rRNA pseudouridine2605 synthase
MKKKFPPREKNRAVPERHEPAPGLIRLNRYLANAGVCSRREADTFIEQGLVSINGKVVTELGTKVKLSDTVKYKGKVLKPETLRYILLNKPKGYITTTDDEMDRKTVMEIIKDACPERVYPVGRLDRNTTGLLLLTNDGELAKKLTHPSHQIRKMYHVFLDKPLRLEDFEKLMMGITLEDGPVKPDSMAYVGDNSKGDEVGIEIHSGRNRIVRRMFEQLGYDVVRLDRVQFASLTKKDLPRGEWRFLNPKEIAFLKML